MTESQLALPFAVVSAAPEWLVRQFATALVLLPFGPPLALMILLSVSSRHKSLLLATAAYNKLPFVVLVFPTVLVCSVATSTELQSAILNQIIIT